jgi:anhydro-N-acetylmuramic acid kinase
VGELLLSGGGARNPVLVEAITAAVSDAWRARGAMEPPVVAPFDATYFDAEAKEAVAFAFLGYLHLMGRAGNVPAATGAHAARVLGAFTPTAPS